MKNKKAAILTTLTIVIVALLLFLSTYTYFNSQKIVQLGGESNYGLEERYSSFENFLKNNPSATIQEIQEFLGKDGVTQEYNTPQGAARQKYSLEETRKKEAARQYYAFSYIESKMRNKISDNKKFEAMSDYDSKEGQNLRAERGLPPNGLKSSDESYNKKGEQIMQEITDKANEKDSELLQVMKIFEGIVNQMSNYNTKARSYSGYEALVNGEGVCRHSSSLLIKALRIKGIKAEAVVGTRTKTSLGEKVPSSHVWVRVTLKNGMNFDLDPTSFKSFYPLEPRKIN